MRNSFCAAVARLLAVALPIGALLFGGIGSASRVVAQDAAPTFRFVTPEAIAALVVQPRRAFEAPGAELYPREIVSAAAKQEFGIDPLEIELAVAFVESPDQPGPPPFGVVLKMTKPQDRQTLLPALLNGATPATLASGRPYLKAAAPGMPSVMLPNERTIVIAPEAMLEKMSKAGGGDSPLQKLLRGIPQDRQVVAVATLDPVRDQIQGALAQAPQLPPPLESFKTLPSLVSSLEVRSNLTGQMEFELVFRTSGAGNAEQVRALLSNGLAFGKEMLLAQAAASLAQGPQDPVKVASGAYLQRVADHFATMLEPKATGSDVTVAAKLDANMASTGVMVGLLLPAVQSARAAASRASVSNNLKQIGLSFHNYHDVYRRLPPPAIVDATGKPLLSWRVAVLPFLGHDDLYRQFNLKEPWDSEHNRALIAKMPNVYLKPGARNEGKTTYQVPVGEGTLFPSSDAKVGFRDVLDGTSNTLMVVETAPDRAVTWTKPDDFAVDAQRPAAGLIAPGANVLQVVFTDGSVRTLPGTLPAATLKALFTPRGAEVVQLP